MSTLVVDRFDVEVLNVATLLTDTVTANSVVSSGNVTAARVITTIPEYQFIERIPLAGMAMANTSNIAGYSQVRIIIENVQGANDTSDLWLQFSNDGGTVYANANNYSSHYTYLEGVLGFNGVTGDSGTGHRLTRWGISNLANSGGVSGIMDILSNKPGLDNRYQSIIHYRSGETGVDGPWNYAQRGMGRVNRVSKITNLRFKMTRNDIIANGTLTIEGLPG